MNLFKKIIEYIKNIFKKEDLVMLPETDESVTVNTESEVKSVKPNIFDIELLQRKYENNLVKVDDLTDEEIDMLNDLYLSQIEKLNVIKADKERQIRDVEEKINKIKLAV